MASAERVVLQLPAPAVARCCYVEDTYPGSLMLCHAWKPEAARDTDRPAVLIELTEDNRRRLLAAGFTLLED